MNFVINARHDIRVLHVFLSGSKSLKRVMSGVLIDRLPECLRWSIFNRNMREHNAHAHTISIAVAENEMDETVGSFFARGHS